MLAYKKKLWIISLAILLLSFLIKGEPPNNEGYLTMNTDYTANFSADFDYVNKRWLVVYEKYDKIYGRLVSLDKTFYSVEFELNNLGCSATEKCFDPYVKFGCDGGTCKFLIAYVRGTTVYYNILDQDGDPLFNNPMTVSPLSSTYPSVEFDYVNKRFFIVFSEQNTGTIFDISGVLVNFSDGLTFGSKISISNAFRNQIKPSVAFSESLSYIVVWQDHRADDFGDIYYQFISKDGQRIGENSGVGLLPARREVNPYVFWLPSINKFIVLYKTVLGFTKPGEGKECPKIKISGLFGTSEIETCEKGNYVYSTIDPTGKVSFPKWIITSAYDLSESDSEHYARMGTNYIIFAGDAYYSMDRRRHFAIMKFDKDEATYVLSNPTFWFPNHYRVKMGLFSTSGPFCPPAREHPDDFVITLEPSDFVPEERKAKTHIPVLFPRGNLAADRRAKIFVSATTYPEINTALVIFGASSFPNNLSLVTIDTDPVMFDYEYLSQTSLPVAVTNTCYISYGQPPCTGAYQIRVTGGKPPYTFQVVAGQMPPGLTVNSPGTITGFVYPINVSSVCDPYPCPFTFSVLVSDSSNPKKSSCMTFEILLFPSPEVKLDYPQQISLCTKANKSKSEDIEIWNKGTPVTIQIFEPEMVSFGETATCSTANFVYTNLFPPACSPTGSSIDPFYLEIYSQQTIVGSGCPIFSCACECTKFKYELNPGWLIDGRIYFSSATYGEYTTRITFHVIDSVLGYSESHTINVKAFVLAQDLFVTSDRPISPSGCTNYTSVCTTYNINLGSMYVGQNANFSIYLGNAVTSASDLGCPEDVYLEVLTVYAPPNQNFRILSPPPSEFGTIGPVSIPGGSTRPIAIEVSGVSAGSITFPIIIYSDDPDERRVVVIVSAYFNPVTFNVPSIVDCGLNLKGNPPLTCFIGIQNLSPVSVPINSIGISGSTQFYLTGSTNLTIPPFSTYMLQVSFASSITGLHLGILTLYMDSAPFFVSVGLKGQVIDKDNLLRIEPSSLDFGNVVTGAGITSGIRFINMSLYDLYISPNYIDYPFSFPSASSVYIPAGQERSIAVNFTPDSLDTFTSNAIFTVSSERFSYILGYPVSGTGVDPESVGLNASVRFIPDYINFGDIILCSPVKCSASIRTLNIINTGNVPLNLVSFSHPSNISNYSITTPLIIEDFYVTDFVARALNKGATVGNIVFNFSSTAGSFSRTVTFYINGVSPAISVSPDSISFGAVKVGEESIFMLSVSNTGNYKLTVTNISLNQPFFSDVPVPFEIQAGESRRIPISFRPREISSYQNYIRIYSDAPYSEVLTVQVSGRGEENPLPVADVSPTSIDFGKVRMGNTKSEVLTIRNIGTSKLFVSSISSLAQDFLPKLDQILPLAIDSNNSVTFVITFSPSDEKAFDSFVILKTNDANKPEIRISVKGEGANPHIRVPTEVNFGGVRRGKTVKREFPIENTGNLPLQAEISITKDDEFIFVSDYLGEVTERFSITIPEKSSSKLDIYFTPPGLEKYRATITIKSDDPLYSFIEVPVSGEGGFPVLSMNVNEIDFGEIYIDERKEYEVSVSNLGNAPLEVTLYVNEQVFGVSVSSFVVPPQEIYNVKFVFAPNGKEGVFSSKVTVITDDPKNSELEIVLKGRAKRFSYIPVGSGCSCSSASPISLDLFLILISALFFFVRSRKNLLKKLIRLFPLIFCSLILSHTVYSQEVSLNINNFYPYQDISNFSFLRTTHSRPKKTLGWGGFFSFAKDPLMLKIAKGEQSISKQAIVDYSIYSGVVLSYVPAENFEVGTFLPVSIVGGVQNQFSLSDIFLEAKYLVFSEKELFSLSLNPQIGIPTFGGDFASNRSISPRLGFIISRETKLGNFLLNTSGNIGFEYRPERAVADLNVGSQAYFMLGGSLSFRQINFSFEAISFMSLEELREEAIPAEALISVGGEFSELRVRIGGGGGLTQGIGSPKYRFFVIFTYDLQPSVPPVKYMKVEGRVLDNLGREVPKGVVYVQESGVSSQIKDGKFEMELPDGRWTFKVVSPGYETKTQVFLIPDQKPEINVRKLDPQIVIAPTDRFGISQTIELNIKTPEGVIKTSSDVAAISTSGNIDIQTKDISRSVIVPPDEIIWINLIYREPIEAKKEQQTQQQQKETKQRGKQEVAQTKKVGTKETKQKKEKVSQPERSETQPRDLAQKAELEKTEKLPETQLETTETVKDKEQSSQEPVVSAEKPFEKPREKITEKASAERERIVGQRTKTTEKITEKSGPSKPSEEISEKIEEKTEILEPKIQTQEKITTKEHTTKEQKTYVERESKIFHTEQIGQERRIEEQKTSVASLPKKEEVKKEETAVIPFKFEEKKELESKLSLLISKVFDSFTVNRWDIPKSAYDDLDRVAQIILENKDRISSIRIEGHTDITGPEFWNVELSYLRANEIRRYLYKRGVKIPIEIIGYSYMRPIDTNETEEGRRKNRRTEVKVFSEGE